MINKKKYIVKIDCQSEKILDDKYVENIEYFYKKDCSFEVLLVDTSNVIDLNINTIVNQFILDCKNNKGILSDTYINKIDEFTKNVIKVYKQHWIEKKSEYSLFDVIAPNGNYFIVVIPTILIGKDKIEDFRWLGKDYLLGSVTSSIIFEYILPRFYQFCFEYDLFDDALNSDLLKYQIGLH